MSKNVLYLADSLGFSGYIAFIPEKEHQASTKPKHTNGTEPAPKQNKKAATKKQES